MRTTFVLSDAVSTQLNQMTTETGQTMSEYIEGAIQHQLLENLQDIQDARKRNEEQTFPFDELVAELKNERKL